MKKLGKEGIKLMIEQIPIIDYLIIGELFVHLKEHEAGIQFYKKFKKMYRLRLGFNDEEFDFDLLTVMKKIATTYYILKEFKKAIKYEEKVAKANVIKYGEESPTMIDIYNDLAVLYLEAKMPHLAINCAQTVIDIAKKYSDEPCPELSISYNCLGSAFNELGQYNEALEYHKKALELTIAFYKEKDYRVAATNNYLGIVYANLNKFDEGIECYLKAKEILKNLYGKKRKQNDFAAIHNNLGCLFRIKGELKESLKHFHKAEKKRLACYCGDKANSFVSLYNNIGITHRIGKEYKEAIEFHTKAENCFNYTLEDYSKILFYLGKNYSDATELKLAISKFKNCQQLMQFLFGEFHPETILLASCLGTVYGLLGEKNTQEEIEKKILADAPKITEEILKESSNYQNSIARIFIRQKEYEKARQICQAQEKITVNVFSELHPSNTQTYYNLGLIDLELGNYVPSLDAFTKCENIAAPTEGRNYGPELIGLFNNLGAVNKRMGQERNAMVYFKRLENIIYKFFGDTHSGLIRADNNIGNIYKKWNEPKKALVYLLRALNFRIQHYSNRDAALATTYNNLMAVYRCLKMPEKLNESAELAKKVIDGRYKGQPDYQLIKTYDNYAIHYRSLNEIEKAIENFKIAGEIRKKIYGEEHYLNGETFYNIGKTYTILRKFPEAIEQYKKAEEFFVKNKRDQHPILGKSYMNMAIDYYTMEDRENALTYFEKAEVIKTKLHGTEHKDFMKIFPMMSEIFEHRHNIDKMLEYYLKIEAIKYSIQGDDAKDYDDLFNKIFNVYYEKQMWPKCVKYMRKLEEYQVRNKYGYCLYNTYKTLGTLYNKLEIYKSASESFENAVKKHPESKDDDKDSTIGEVYLGLGKAYAEMKDHEKSMTSYLKAESIYSKIERANDFPIALIYDGIGDAHTSLNETEKALEYYSKSEKIKMDLNLGETQTMAMTYQKFSQVYLIKENEKEVMNYLNKAEDVLNKCNPQAHPIPSDIFINRGQACAKLKKKEEAKQFYEKAKEMVKAKFTEDHPYYGEALLEYGEIYYLNFAIQDGITILEQAKDILGKHYGDAHRWIVRAYQSLSLAYKEKGDKAASESYQKLSELIAQQLNRI